MKASQIIAEAVAATVSKAIEAGMVTTEAELQTAGRAAMSLIMANQPALYAAYENEVADILGVAA